MWGISFRDRESIDLGWLKGYRLVRIGVCPNFCLLWLPANVLLNKSKCQQKSMCIFKGQIRTQQISLNCNEQVLKQDQWSPWPLKTKPSNHTIGFRCGAVPYRSRSFGKPLEGLVERYINVFCRILRILKSYYIINSLLTCWNLSDHQDYYISSRVIPMNLQLPLLMGREGTLKYTYIRCIYPWRVLSFQKVLPIPPHSPAQWFAIVSIIATTCQIRCHECQVVSSIHLKHTAQKMHMFLKNVTFCET